jgi:hypothetical protein
MSPRSLQTRSPNEKRAIDISAASIHLHDVVSAFSAVRVLTFDDDVVNDDAAADTGAQRPHHRAGRVVSGADPELAECGGVGVVLQHGRLLQAIRNVLTNLESVPRWQVARSQQHSRRDVHRAGSRQSNRVHVVHRQARLLDGVEDAAFEIRHADFRRLPGFGRDNALRQRLAVVIHDSDFDRRASDIDTDEKWWLSLGADRHRRLPSGWV